MLVAPVVSRGVVMAALLFVTCGQRPAFTEDDRALVTELAARVSTAVEQAERFQQTRQVSMALQSAMLSAPPRHPLVEVHARYLPAVADLEVGGDWYDAFALPGGDLAVGVGDVAGHDLSAAAAMGQLRSMLRALAYETEGAPSDVVARLDRVASRLRRHRLHDAGVRADRAARRRDGVPLGQRRAPPARARTGGGGADAAHRRRGGGAGRRARAAPGGPGGGARGRVDAAALHRRPARAAQRPRRPRAGRAARPRPPRQGAGAAGPVRAPRARHRPRTPATTWSSSRCGCRRERPFPELVARARALAVPGRRALLGVVGSPGSGKSTLTETLLAALRADPPAGGGPRLGGARADGRLPPRRRRAGTRSGGGTPRARRTRSTPGATSRCCARLRARDPADAVVYAPAFERTLEQPLAGAIPVPAAARLVLTEGNYLLLDSGRWPAVAPLLDEVWFCALRDDVRLQRLLARHVAFGKPPDAARAWVAAVDEPNAALIEATRTRADLVVPSAVLETIGDPPPVA